MANAFWAAPRPPKVRPPNLWTGAQMTWTHPGSIDPETGEPRVWNLTDWRSGVLMLAGVTGMDLEESTRHTSEAATVHGSRFRSQRWGERPVFWPVSVCQMDGTQAWLDYDREWWDALNPRMTGVWRVTQPNGQWRELTCRPVSGGGHEWAKAPGLRYWTNYGVHLVAEDPFWYGPEITSPLWTSADPVDFIDTSGTAATYAWTGTPGASTSTESVDGVVVRENLCPNPSLEVDTSGWGPNAQSGHTLVRSTDEAWSGSASALVTVGDFGPNLGARFRLPDPGIPAGTTVTVSCYAKVAPGTPTPTGADVLCRDDGAGNTYLSESATMTDEGDGWVRISHTHTVPSGLHLTSPYFMLRNVGGWSAGQQAYFDACLIGASGTYFDGDTPDEKSGGPPFHPGSATTIDSATLTNPGKEQAWPTFTAAGGSSGISAFSVGIDGHVLEYSEPIPAGEVLEIRTDPTKSQGAWLNGENVNRYLVKHDFTSIPPGETVNLDVTMVGGGTLQASFRPKFDRAW